MNKILILSEENDVSTSFVSKWLRHYKIKHKRINSREFIINESLKFDFSNDIIPEKFAVWYRRTPILNSISFSDSKDKMDIQNTLSMALHNETKEIYDYFYFKLTSDNYILGNKDLCSINKLKQLEIAKSADLKIPNSLVTNKKKDLLMFYNNNESKIITKPIYNISFFVDKESDLRFVPYTELIEEAIINALPDTIFPVLVQKCIEKKFEIRTFFLDGICYSMAIFSQASDQTKVDFRVYDFDKPNRRVPYKLPNEIELKIIKFMKLIGLNTGSIDLIYGNDDNYYFLEVNPVGQFGMVSYPCNYHLEEKVATLLINKQKDNE